MIIHSIVRSMRKPVASAIAVVALTWLGLAHSVEPVSAKPTKCQIKHSYCQERCIANNKHHSEDSISKAAACGARTCDHQFRACARESGESMDPNHGPDKPRGKPGKGRGKRELTSSGSPNQQPRPLGGGILESGGGLAQQGPAATGSPVSAPSAPAAPPVILR